MPHHRRFRRALAAALLVVVPLSGALAGCGAGTKAETLEVNPDTPATTLGNLKVQNVVLLTGPLADGGPLAVTGSIYNGGALPDVLQGVSVNELPLPAAFTFTPTSPDLRIPSAKSLQLGGPGNVGAVVPNAADLVRAGMSRRVTFSFARAGEVSLWVTVLRAEGVYAGYGPIAAVAGP
ncbi:DUF461 domain-containing protein [Yinghuangia seranimata]|uniref:DUF461 domain-containing protein n=1 Tax=Yinghuangia seranimata TaxID=408067 RepID=UPI00248C7B5C|nr:DUF461 domain-containing protein [Yinghuangia seranimata]MDI2128898.1 DUF461 domain-containing protein [Yinghuangia seranimata]